MRAPKTKILIIDDEPVIRNLLLDLLAQNGYEVMAAPGGPEGIARAEEMEFDIIFSDIHMPKMNGLETIRRIKEIRPHTVFVVMESYPDKDCELATKEGVVAHLQKPFNISDVLSVVEDILCCPLGGK
jgi:two-component system response regulator (stage 0 sporulation protein F)